ncbi:hypothetical protein ACPBEH_03435 [Latilactobacillus sp. 5-91]|uniref:hypothetical protein n=1 Tax=Latilactobacillus sp. 5-91 TaxID=3410924 RepID=UPI003C77F688
MNLFLMIFAIISGILAFVVLGFLIVLIVGLSTKSISTKKVGKLGIIVSAPLLFISLVCVLGTNSYVKNTAANKARIAKAEQKKKAIEASQMDKSFDKASTEFTSEYLVLWSSAENLAQKEQSAWSDAIDNSGDDFDIDGALEKIENDNKSTIDGLLSHLSSLKNDLNKMEESDTGTYDYAAYEKAYKSARKTTDFVTSLSGSYNSFGSTFQELDQSMSDEYSNLTDN